MITRLGLAAAHLFPIGVCPSFFAGSFEMRIFNDSANDSGDSVYQKPQKNTSLKILNKMND